MSEDEIREKKLDAVHRESEREIAEEEFNRAIEEGADPREAAYRAERAVRDSKVEKKTKSLGDASKEVGSAEAALERQVQTEVSQYEDISIIRESAFRNLSDAFYNPEGENFKVIARESVREGKVGEGLFATL